VKDGRLYGKFTLNFPDHPKIMILSDSAFRCLVSATLWSREQQTDGFLARRLAVAKWSLADLQELCTNDDDKPSLIEREEGWYIHDYAEHQDTKADIEARRERNKLAGQKGGLAKGKRTAKRGAKQPVSAVLSEVVSENLAEKEKGLRARESSQNAPTADGPEPPLRCPIHRNHTDPPPCARCKDARKANEAWHDNDLSRRRDAKAAAAVLRDNCPRCEGTNTYENEDGEVRKCWPHLEPQVADHA
jgi:hypothetical protein